MNQRRFALYKMTLDGLTLLLTERDDCFRFRMGVPAGAKLVRTALLPEEDMLCLTYEHPSFTDICEGAHLPVHPLAMEICRGQ